MKRMRNRRTRSAGILALAALAFAGAGCSLDQEAFYNILYVLVQSYGESLAE